MFGIARVLALALAAAVSSGAAFAEDTLKLAVGQRGLWDTSISDVGQRTGRKNNQKHRQSRRRLHQADHDRRHRGAADHRLLRRQRLN